MFHCASYTIVNFYTICAMLYIYSHVKKRILYTVVKNVLFNFKNLLHKLRCAFQVYLPQFKHRVHAISTQDKLSKIETTVTNTCRLKLLFYLSEEKCNNAIQIKFTDLFLTSSDLKSRVF